MWQALISPITSLLGQVLKNKAEEKAAVHTAKMQVIQNTASWEQLMASASATSWKDEWFTLLLSAPVVALMWGIGMNDVEIIDRIGLAFSELNRLPDWYQYLLFMAVSASFGIRGADKLLALKGKKQMAVDFDPNDNPFDDLKDDSNPLMPNDGQPSPDGYIEEQGDFGGLNPLLVQFNLLLSKWIEGLDSDDMDRVNRQQAAGEWLVLLSQYKNGDISLEELKEFDDEELSEMPGWSEYFEGVGEDPVGDDEDDEDDNDNGDDLTEDGSGDVAGEIEKDATETEKDKDIAETEKDKDATEAEKDKDATEAEKDKDAAAEPEEKEKDDIAEAEKDKDADAQTAAEEEEKEKDGTGEPPAGDLNQPPPGDGEREQWTVSFCPSGYSRSDGQGGVECVPIQEVTDRQLEDGERRTKERAETEKDDVAAEELEKDLAENVANNAGINKDAEKDTALADTTKDGDGDGDGDDGQAGDSGEDQNESVESKDQGENQLKDGEDSDTDLNTKDDLPGIPNGSGNDGSPDSGGEQDVLNLFKGLGLGAAASGGFNPPAAEDFMYRLDFNPPTESGPVFTNEDYLAQLERFDSPEQQLDRIIKRAGMLT